MNIKKIGIASIIPVLGVLWGAGTYLDNRWQHRQDFELFAQASQKAIQKTQEALEKTNARIEFQSLRDELKYVRERIATIKDRYEGKQMPLEAKETLRELKLREQDIMVQLDAWNKK
jgi:predicted transposase YdaD